MQTVDINSNKDIKVVEVTFQICECVFVWNDLALESASKSWIF